MRGPVFFLGICFFPKDCLDYMFMEELRQKGKDIYYWEFQCDGLIAQIASSDFGAVRVRIGFRREEHFLSELKTVMPDAELFEDPEPNKVLSSTLRAYLRGENPPMGIPWDINATAFRHKVWRSVCKIPYGGAKTYKYIAQRLGMPKGARAVGQALNRNPLLVIIPCHRVVAADGLGGFGSGIAMKRYLLNLEGS